MPPNCSQYPANSLENEQSRQSLQHRVTHFLGRDKYKWFTSLESIKNYNSKIIYQVIKCVATINFTALQRKVLQFICRSWTKYCSVGKKMEEKFSSNPVCDPKPDNQNIRNTSQCNAVQFPSPVVSFFPHNNFFK